MPNKSNFFIESLSPLYEAVQSADIFPDSKFFVDCVPKYPASLILENYQLARQQPGFDLKKFIGDHFNFPEDPAVVYESAHKPLVQHLHDLWPFLERTPSGATPGTLIALPNPYIIPGGRFREIYYWDSYFTMLGLKVCGQLDMIENMVDNFAYLISKVGFIPNGNRTYYLGRSQPPFFSLMVHLLSEIKGHTVLYKYQPVLEKEYEFWMDGAITLHEKNPCFRRVVRLEDGSILNRYWDDQQTPRPEAYKEDVELAKEAAGDSASTWRHIRAAAESGWDFSSRWFADGTHMHTIETTHLIPVDLNCLLLHLEETLLDIYREIGDIINTRLFKSKVAHRKKAIQHYFWEEGKGFYFDYHFREKTRTNRYSLAAVYPLFFKVAEHQQAEKVSFHLEKQFLFPGGLVTTPYRTGQQWDAPNGWAPLQWLAYKGLQNFGLSGLAEQVKKHWTENCFQVYQNTGKMMEKYNVMDTNTKAGGGEYPNQDGFGWTNGVYLAMTSE